MTDKVDRKLQEIRVAEFRYRHEAEFAAGFLDEAGIPYRLQLDDAGGADLGLAMLHPAAIWVRAIDADAARELVRLEEDGSDTWETVEPAPAVRSARPGKPVDSRLSRLERAVSAGLAVSISVVAPNLPPMPMRESVLVVCFVAGLAFFGAALVGRAPGVLGDFVRMLSGSPPR